MVVSQGRGAPGSAHKWGAHGLEVGRAVEFTFLSGPALHCPGCTRLGESSPLLYPPLSPPSDLSVGTRTPSIWRSCPPPAVTSPFLSCLWAAISHLPVVSAVHPHSCPLHSVPVPTLPSSLPILSHLSPGQVSRAFPVHSTVCSASFQLCSGPSPCWGPHSAPAGGPLLLPSTHTSLLTSGLLLCSLKHPQQTHRLCHR